MYSSLSKSIWAVHLPVTKNIEKKELQFTAAEFKTNLTQEQKLLNELKTSIKEKRNL